MKFFLVALLAFVAVASAEHHLNLSEEQRARVRTYSHECREKEGVTSEQVHALREGHFEHPDHKVECFANCFMEKVGFFINGVVQADVVSTKLTPLVGAEKYHAIAEKCNAIHGAEKCETAYKFYKCYFENHASML